MRIKNYKEFIKENNSNQELKYENPNYHPELIDIGDKLLDTRTYYKKYGIPVMDIIERYRKDIKSAKILHMYLEDKPFEELLNNYKTDKLYFYNINEKTHDIEETVIQIDIYRGDLDWKSDSLVGSPLIVYGTFYCDNCDLTSLIYCPIVVTDYFSCSYNSLTSLKYCPIIVGKSFHCSYNYLTDLQYVPKYINGNFNCMNNNLTTLKYAPEKVKGNFYCEYNSNLPKEELERYRNYCCVKGNFYC